MSEDSRLEETLNRKLTMTAAEIFERHPLPWSHHLLLIKDANGRQVVHTGGAYNERGRPHQGEYLSGLNALLVDSVNSGSASAVNERATLQEIAEAARAFVWEPENWEAYQDSKDSDSVAWPPEFLLLAQAVEKQCGPMPHDADCDCGSCPARAALTEKGVRD
jgi:hypothetical protein